MSKWMQKFFLVPEKSTLLLVLNVLLGFSFIVLSNLHVLPLGVGDFFFFAFVVFLAALSRPGWVFALFVGMLPYEIINLAPVSFGFDFRPYQFLAVLLGLSVVIRVIAQKTSRKLFSWSFFDSIVLLFGFSGMLSLAFLPDASWFFATFRQEIIVLSFAFLYFLGRVFLKSFDDIRIAGRFFLVSTMVVLLYSLWQSIRMKYDLPAFEVMAGRPNGTFPEADWLGGFVAAILAFLVPLSLAEFFSRDGVQKVRLGFHFFVLKIGFLVLILSVSRSAWLAAFVGVLAASILFAIRSGVFSLDREKWKRMFFGKVFIASAFLLSFFVVLGFELSSFDLFARGGSVGSGLQKITVSCDAVILSLPEKISGTEDLSLYGCRHIDLEDIARENQAGHWVTEVFRSDPNISIRRDIYMQSFSLLSQFPFFGIGWGNSSRYLGSDDRGMGLNSSNMFLESWLGGGLIGGISFCVLWVFFGWMLVRRVLSQSKSLQCVIPSDVLCGFFGVWVSISVFNLFNAGLLLGSLWVFLSCAWFFCSRNIE